MKTVLEILSLTTEHLKSKGVQNARREAEELLSDVLGMQRMSLYLEYDRPLAESELDQCRQWLTRRAKGEPLQYIKGLVNFYGCTLKVNEDVLIPRPETEILVDKITQSLSQIDLSGKVLWDICCGSGCLGLSLKKQFPELKVVLSDLSLPALEIARENAKANELEVEWMHGDLLLPFKGRKTDFMVCNPPYVSELEYLVLDNEVKREPQQALLAGPTGLEFYQRLANDLPNFLNHSAKVWLEIGTGQGEAVKKIFGDPFFKTCLVERDWAGHDRFFSLEIE